MTDVHHWKAKYQLLLNLDNEMQSKLLHISSNYMSKTDTIRKLIEKEYNRLKQEGSVNENILDRTIQ